MGRVTVNTGGTHTFIRENNNRRGDLSYRPYELINNEKVFYETIHDKRVYYENHGEKRYFGFVKGSEVKVYYDSDKSMILLDKTSNTEFKKWVHNQKNKRVAIESSVQYPQEKREAKHLKWKKTAISQKSKSEEEKAEKARIERVQKEFALRIREAQKQEKKKIEQAGEVKETQKQEKNKRVAIESGMQYNQEGRAEEETQIFGEQYGKE